MVSSSEIPSKESQGEDNQRGKTIRIQESYNPQPAEVRPPKPTPPPPPPPPPPPTKKEDSGS